MKISNLIKENKSFILFLFFLIIIFLALFSISYSIQYFAIIITIFSIYMIIFSIVTYLFYSKDTRKLSEIKKYPKISVLVAAYNNFPYLYGCLDTIINSKYKGEIETILISDGSFDTKKYKKNKNFKEIVFNKEFFKNDGIINIKSKSLNKAYEFATGEYLVTIDADSYLQENTIQKMVEFSLLNDHNFGAGICLVVPRESNSFLQRIQHIEYCICMGFLNHVMSKINSIMVIPGPFTIYKKKVIDEIGFFDLKNITEDMEITWRMHKLGYRVLKCDGTYVETDVPNAINHLIRQRTRWLRGRIQTIFNYVDLFLNPKYKDFGIFSFPYLFSLELIGVFMLFLVFFANLYNFLRIFINALNIYFVGGLIPFPHLSPFIIGSSFYFSILFLFLSLIYMYIGTSIIGNFKFEKKDVISFLLYFTLYWFFFFSVYTKCLFDEARGAKYKW